MLETLWIILFILGLLLIFIIADLDYNDYPVYWCLMLTLLDTIIWFLLSGATYEIEQPYQMFNATSGNIETGIHIVTSKVSVEISYFCMMMAVIMMAYGAYAFLNTFREIGKE